MEDARTTLLRAVLDVVQEANRLVNRISLEMDATAIRAAAQYWRQGAEELERLAALLEGPAAAA